MSATSSSQGYKLFMLLISIGILLFFGGVLICLIADRDISYALLARTRREITQEEFYDRYGSYISNVFAGKIVAFVGLLVIHVNSLLLLIFKGRELSPNEKLGLLLLIALTMLLYVALVRPAMVFLLLPP